MRTLVSDRVSQILLSSSSYRLGILMLDHGRAGAMGLARILEVDVGAAACKLYCVSFAHGGVAMEYCGEYDRRVGVES